MRKYLFGALFILLSALFMASCARGNDLLLPSTPALSGDGWWGITSESYLRIYSERGNQGHIMATLRRGDIAKIKEIRSHYDESRKIYVDYYGLELSGGGEGWISADKMDKYNVVEQAKDAQKRLKQFEGRSPDGNS